MSLVNIAENLERVREEIRNACISSGRKENEVLLCAVSKFHPAEDVVEAMKSGQVLFGENRVQEACEKFSQVKAMGFTPDFHIIGNLQTNKIKKACEIASCIQSVDREDVLREAEKHLARMNRFLEVYFELHTAEDSKSGYGSEDDLLRSCENIASGLYPHIVPKGLMTMAPFTDDERLVRTSFQKTRILRDRLNREFPDLPIQVLSMGMSGDYKIAIEEGSTMVRVGTAIFGERDYSR